MLEAVPLLGTDLVHVVEDQESLSLSHVQRKTVSRALSRTGGDKAQAAMLLGIGRTTLYRRLREYGIA